MKKLLLITATVFFMQTGNAQTNIDYFGQTPPGDKAVKFAPGIISLSNRGEYKILFSSDGSECYISRYINDTMRTYYTKRINNSWTDQKEASFSVHKNFVLTNISADGKTIFLTKYNSTFSNGEILKVERTAEGWSEPQYLPAPINSSSNDGGYTETSDSVIYIDSNRNGKSNIWRMRYMPDKTIVAENLGLIINSAPSNFSPCIAPDESYLIYTQSNGTYEHLYISFNKGNNEWTKPLNMDKSGAGINKFYQISPSLSPDGKYLFYCSKKDPDYADSTDIYWVSTHIIVGLKKFAYAPRLSKQIPDMDVKTDSVISYVIPENTFFCEYGTDKLKYTATLKNGSVLPSWLKFDPATRTLSGTPKQAEIDSIAVTATLGDTASASCTFRINVSSKVGISQLDENKIKISPNPTTGLINLSFGNSVKNAKVEICNLQGAQVYSKTFHNTPSATIDLTGNSAGIYMVKVIADGVSYEEKIVKE